MQVKISLLYNQFLARTNVALTSRMPCNSPYIFNYPLEYLAHWLFFGKFLSRASNTMPPRVRSPRPNCPCLIISLAIQLDRVEESVQYLDDSNVANMDPTPGLTLKSFGRRHDVFRYLCIPYRHNKNDNLLFLGEQNPP